MMLCKVLEYTRSRLGKNPVQHIGKGEGKKPLPRSFCGFYSELMSNVENATLPRHIREQKLNRIWSLPAVVTFPLTWQKFLFTSMTDTILTNTRWCSPARFTGKQYHPYSFWTTQHACIQAATCIIMNIQKLPCPFLEPWLRKHHHPRKMSCTKTKTAGPGEITFLHICLAYTAGYNW